MNEPIRVAVLAYDHKHGTDIEVYASVGLATHGAADIVIKYLDEVRDQKVKSQLKWFYDNVNWPQLLELWAQYQSDQDFPETLSITETNIITAVT